MKEKECDCGFCETGRDSRGTTGDGLSLLDITVAWEADWGRCFGKKMQRREAIVEEEWNEDVRAQAVVGIQTSGKPGRIGGRRVEGDRNFGRRKLNSGQDTIQSPVRESGGLVWKTVQSDSDKTRRAGAASRERTCTV